MRVDATLGRLASQMPIPIIELSPFHSLFHLSCSSSALFFVSFNLFWSFSASSALHLVFPALHPSSSTVHSASLARLMLLFRHSFLIFSFSRSFSIYPSLRPVSLALYLTSSDLYSVSFALILLLFRLSYLLSNFPWSLLAAPSRHLLSCSTSYVFFSIYSVSSALLLLLFRLSFLLFSFSWSLLAVPALHPTTSSLYSVSSAPFPPFLNAIQLLLDTFSLSCSSSIVFCSPSASHVLFPAPLSPFPLAIISFSW